ncbi:hypothetical protein F442_10805 [Phytophthora nicotianae P10297]|uniref:Uncharacterized protein n=2 Tax=Phytophthora nicotianae TaxID=4792 RepID=W2Q667_PHYN3|nr:hypothetical protein PPTG_23133 [Phytophthora nicotianae INRA-310]ETN08049.1 hypothetical protein PPTG_23133 [Phytophthora nicotianae INRA-310]ETP42285.1 hypothetical protein F442_10805 [Phytophthora nicotianae P10297]
MSVKPIVESTLDTPERDICQKLGGDYSIFREKMDFESSIGEVDALVRDQAKLSRFRVNFNSSDSARNKQAFVELSQIELSQT